MSRRKSKETRLEKIYLHREVLLNGLYILLAITSLVLPVIIFQIYR